MLSLSHPQEEQISEEISIDHRVHSRLIGARGKAIGKVMEKYKVDIRFPRDKSSDQVTVTGLEENVEDCKEYLLTLAEDYVSAPALIKFFKLTLCNCGGVSIVDALGLVTANNIIFQW